MYSGFMPKGISSDDSFIGRNQETGKFTDQAAGFINIFLNDSGL